MLLAKTDYAGRFIHVPCNIPNVEVLRRVHHKELTEPIHEAGAATEGLLTLASPAIIVHRTPINLNNRQRACIAPNSDGRGVRIVVYTKDSQTKQLE